MNDFRVFAFENASLTLGGVAARLMYGWLFDDFGFTTPQLTLYFAILAGVIFAIWALYTLKITRGVEMNYSSVPETVEDTEIPTIEVDDRNEHTNSSKDHRNDEQIPLTEDVVD